MSIKREDVEVKFINDEDKEEVIDIYVIKPGNSIAKKADRYRARMWNECVTDGVPTKLEMHKLLVSRGIWSDSKGDEERKISEEIAQLEKELYIGDGKKKHKLSDGQIIAINIRKKRIKLQLLMAEKLEMEQNSAEALADNSRFDYLVASCTYHKNGEKVYNDVDDYDEHSDDPVAFSAANALYKLLYTIGEDFHSALPENKWLIDHNLVDDKLSLVNEEGKLVSTDGRLIDKSGHYVDSEGKRVDIDGNKLNEDGTYVSNIEYENDLAKAPVKKRRTRKTNSTDSNSKVGSK